MKTMKVKFTEDLNIMYIDRDVNEVVNYSEIGEYVAPTKSIDSGLKLIRDIYENNTEISGYYVIYAVRGTLDNEIPLFKVYPGNDELLVTSIK